MKYIEYRGKLINLDMYPRIIDVGDEGVRFEDAEGFGMTINYQYETVRKFIVSDEKILKINVLE